MNGGFITEELKNEIGNLDGWKISGGGLHKCFTFESHIDAVKFVEAASLEAISEGSYPEIRLTLEAVEISFRPEDEKELFKGINLAKKIDKFADAYEEE